MALSEVTLAATLATTLVSALVSALLLPLVTVGALRSLLVLEWRQPGKVDHGLKLGVLAGVVGPGLAS